MRYWFFIFALIGITTVAYAQRGGGKREGGGFSLSSLSSSQKEIPDSLLLTDSTALKSNQIIGYRLTSLIGDSYIAPMDTNRLNFYNKTLVESQSLAIGYLGNVGSPAQTKLFSERKEARDFIFADAYDYYITTPENAYFYNTKVPYTDVSYTKEGSAKTSNERLKGVITWNFGKRVNMGGNIDYIYSRSPYNSNGTKLLSYRLFGSYHSDTYELNAYLSNYNFVNFENGGLSDDQYITDIDKMNESSKASFSTKDFPVRYSDTWNRVRGKHYFFTHRYNLGFHKTVENPDEEGNPSEIFIPVSSLIHTFNYEDNRRHFTSKMPGIDTCYLISESSGEATARQRLKYVYGLDNGLDDRTSAWNLKNTLALSIREGFQDWAKFGFTAFVHFEKRRFQLPAEIPGFNYTPDGAVPDENTSPDFDIRLNQFFDEFSTYLGGELSKKRGNLLTYTARGELAVVGSDLGEFRLTGDIQTTFKLLGKEASIRGYGSIKNVTPSFYQRHLNSRYFWWDNKLKNIQQAKVGAEIKLGSSHTTMLGEIESIQHYVYFDRLGLPAQFDDNLQVVTLRLKQDAYYRALAWENEVAYQLSSNKEVLPLPMISLYSNLYFHFKLAKVLTVQLGTDIHYNSAYYAPYYEPATQQFVLQDEVKVGNYPLINGYVNLHLKQARFFIMYYNLGAKFVDPNYFSLPHYPLSPMVLKVGIAVVFNN